MTPEDLLARLDPEQREVALALRGPVRVVAGAGSGKTRAITHRVAYGVATGIYRPTEVLAVSFTVDAANEMRTRLIDLGVRGVQTRTFHSAAFRQLKYFWPQFYGGETPSVIGSKIPVVAAAARAIGHRFDPVVLRDIASEIEWCKVSNVVAQDYPAAAAKHDRSVGDLAPATIANLFVAYEDAKREAGKIDMEDQLLLTANMLASDERIAAEVRRQYKWFVVDEFQDVNPLQSLLLDLWLGGRDDLCVVGDPRQTIFSFAGANPMIFGAFGRKFPDATRIELVRNYRSTPQVVATANKLFPHDTVMLQSQNDPGPETTFTGYADEASEAAGIAKAIVELHRQGVAYQEIAVLYRINAQSGEFETALSEAGVPFVLRGTRGFFQRPEVRQAITLMRGAARGGEQSLDVVADARAILTSMGHTDEPPTAAGEVRNRWESLHAITTLVSEFARQHPGATLTDMVAELDRRADNSHAPSADGVTLSTMHAAKGLEWDAVFVAGTHEGTMPLVHAKTDEAVEEERRLLYVGITRARKHLQVSWSMSRTGGKGKRKPSRFIVPLLPYNETATKSKKVAAVPVDSDPVVFEALKAWRKERSTEDKVPAFVVFTDATLHAIAAKKPRTTAELHGISGIGASKREKYGESVVRVVAEAGQ